MIQLKIYGNNSDGNTIERICEKIIFQSFFVGQRRDPINLRVIRNFAEGTILLEKNDFNALKDYFFSQQDAQIRINGTWHWCIVDFIDPNYLTRSVNLNITILDKYSLSFEGTKINSWNDDVFKPTFSKKYTIKEIETFSGNIENHYVDGSQYRYDSSYENIWYRQYMTDEGPKNVTTSDIFKFNIGGTEIDNLLISELYARNSFYKPYSVLYTNPVGSTYRYVSITYIREVRYFTEDEEVSEEWNYLNSTKQINGRTYYMYAKFYGGEQQTYFSGKQVYFIRDEHLTSGYMSVSYNGYYSELQSSPNFVKFNDLLKNLTKAVFNLNLPFDSDVYNDLYAASMKSYNGVENFDDEIFILENIVNYLRERHNIYFKVSDTISFKTLSFPNKLLDIDNFKGKNWHEYNSVKLSTLPKVYEFKSYSKKLDFKDINVNFFGVDSKTQTSSGGVITDCEVINENAEELIIIKAERISKNQINKAFRYAGIAPNFDGTSVKRGEDGSFVKWLISGTLEMFSNDIHLRQNGNGIISFRVNITSGAVKVQIGNFSGYYTANGNYSQSFIGTGKKNVKITIMGGGGTANGEIKLLKVYIATLSPKKQTGLISGFKQLNAKLSLPQQIIDNKPLMSYPRGSLDDIGIIDCNVKYSKEINFIIPLNEEIFELDFDKYMALNGEKWIVFERKRQILTETETSKYDKVKCKSNNIY